MSDYDGEDDHIMGPLAWIGANDAGSTSSAARSKWDSNSRGTTGPDPWPRKIAKESLKQAKKEAERGDPHVIRWIESDSAGVGSFRFACRVIGGSMERAKENLRRIYHDESDY